MTACKEHWRTLHQVSLGRQHEAEDLLEFAQVCQNAELRMHCHHALSMGASAAGNHKLALHEAEQAVNAWPESCFASYRYVQALKNAGHQSNEWLEAAMSIPHIHQPDRFSDSERLLKSMVAGFAEAGWRDRGVDYFQHLINLPETTPASRRLLAAYMQELSGQDAWHVAFDTEARAVLRGFLLDRTMVLVRHGHVVVSGVMVYPVDAGPDTYRGDGITIEMIETSLASPGYGRKFSGHPLAGKSRFRMKLRLENRSVSTVYACWNDGRTLPVLRFKRVEEEPAVGMSDVATSQI